MTIKDKTIKLIALDCDGTLISDNREITPRTKVALIKAQEQGIRVALVSGRPQSGFWYETEELNLKQHHGLIGAYNGGMVIDVESGEIKYQNPIPVEQAKEFLNLIHDYDLTYIVDNGTHLYSNSPDNQYVIHEYRDHRLELVKTEELREELDFDPVKILLTADPERVDEIYDELVDICGDTLGPIRSTPFYLEITTKGVNKSSALDHICKAVNIDKDNVIAFGDQLNDTEMIRDAGIGVAMGNAVDSIKETADIVTSDNNSDGIAEVIEQLLK